MANVPMVPDLNCGGLFQNHSTLFLANSAQAMNVSSPELFSGHPSSLLSCGGLIQNSNSTEPFSLDTVLAHSRQVSFNIPSEAAVDAIDHHGSTRFQMDASQERQQNYGMFQTTGSLSPISGEKMIATDIFHPILEYPQNSKPREYIPSCSEQTPVDGSPNLRHISLETDVVPDNATDLLQDNSQLDSLDLIDKLMAGESNGSLSPYQKQSEDCGSQRHNKFVTQMLLVPQTEAALCRPSARAAEFDLPQNDCLPIQDTIPEGGQAYSLFKNSATDLNEPTENSKNFSENSATWRFDSCQPISAVNPSRTTLSNHRSQVNPKSNPMSDISGGIQAHKFTNYRKHCTPSMLSRQPVARSKLKSSRNELISNGTAGHVNFRRTAKTGGSTDDSSDVIRGATKRKPRTYSRPVPSQHCHICSRRPTTQSPHAACGNLAKGKCRKTICQKCFTLYGWDMTEALVPDNSGWLCPHCSGKCPDRAQCHIYDRTSERRRNNTVNHRKPKLQAKQNKALQNTASGIISFTSRLNSNVNPTLRRKLSKGARQDPFSGTTHSSITVSREQEKSPDSHRASFEYKLTKPGQSKVEEQNIGALLSLGTSHGLYTDFNQACPANFYPVTQKHSNYDNRSNSATKTDTLASGEMNENVAGDVLIELLNAIASENSHRSADGVPIADPLSCGTQVHMASAVPTAGSEVLNFLFDEGIGDLTSNPGDIQSLKA
jgi:hypothetical protein